VLCPRVGPKVENTNRVIERFLPPRLEVRLAPWRRVCLRPNRSRPFLDYSKASPSQFSSIISGRSPNVRADEGRPIIVFANDFGSSGETWRTLRSRGRLGPTIAIVCGILIELIVAVFLEWLVTFAPLHTAIVVLQTASKSRPVASLPLRVFRRAHGRDTAPGVNRVASGSSSRWAAWDMPKNAPVRSWLASKARNFIPSCHTI